MKLPMEKNKETIYYDVKKFKWNKLETLLYHYLGKIGIPVQELYLYEDFGMSPAEEAQT
jgi:hypothetical protein